EVKVRAKDRTAALDALYTLSAGDPVLETMDAFRMMELPSFRSRSCLAKIKSAFEINNIRRGCVTCYMDDI
ncbi:MAG: hypothetical protein WBW14_05925, partial [Candidatus Acidiferrum sp.]